MLAIGEIECGVYKNSGYDFHINPVNLKLV